MKTTYRILLVILLIIFTYISYKVICKKIIYPTKYDKYVEKAAADNDIDPYLIYALIKQESNFNNEAMSSKNAKGLMQILDSTAEETASQIDYIDSQNIDLYDSNTNICIGTKYLKSLINRYNGNIYLGICAYNAGLGNVDKWVLAADIYSNGHVNMSNIPFEETKTYLTNILKYYQKYIDLYS